MCIRDSIYTAAFHGVSLERLEEITDLLMNTDACSQISYAAQQDAETYFSKRAAFEETLDLSAYGGEDGGEIKISYEYENKSSLELFTPQRYQEGQWESFGAVGENTVRMETTGTGMKIRITDGWDYPVDEARITLILSLIHIYHVAELAGAEMRAGVKPAIQHRRAANAGAEAYA